MFSVVGPGGGGRERRRVAIAQSPAVDFCSRLDILDLVVDELASQAVSCRLFYMTRTELLKSVQPIL